MKLTQAEVRAKLKSLGIAFKSLPQTREFKVAGFYFTDDLQDALLTGRVLGTVKVLNNKADVYTKRGRIYATSGTWTHSATKGCVQFAQHGPDGQKFTIPVAEIHDGHGQPIFA